MPHLVAKRRDGYMIYVLLGLLIGVLSALPLALRGKLVGALVYGCFSAAVTTLLSWFFTWSTMGPLAGGFGFLLLVFWAYAAFIDKGEDTYDRRGRREHQASWIWLFPVIYGVIFAGTLIAGSAMVKATSWASMIGTVETREWTKDIQPKDPAHMRMANRENALYQAQKVLGSVGAVGSQFNISEDSMTLQVIKNHLWFIVPLDYTSFSVWLESTTGAPGYIRIDGEDPHAQPEVVKFEEGQSMLYTPGAAMSFNLERHLRYHGYLDAILSDWTFEIDEMGKPWWIVSVADPTFWWSVVKVRGVVAVDPMTGATQFHALGSAPTWIDRVVPERYVELYLDWQGAYSSGWLNSWWGRLNVTTAERPRLIYGANGEPEFVTGITSASAKDNSLIALVYTNSRTGKSVRYVMKGGATETAVLDAVDKNSQVQFKHQHGVDPQLYNINGMPVAVVPLLNESHAFQGVAMVPINDVQTVAVGATQYEALRELESKLSDGSGRMAITERRDISAVNGVVDRIASEAISSGTIYYIHLRGVPHLFTAKSGESAKLPVTSVGDRVHLQYYESARDVVPIKSFDNVSLVLSSSSLQQRLSAETKQ